MISSFFYQLYFNPGFYDSPEPNDALATAETNTADTQSSPPTHGSVSSM